MYKSFTPTFLIENYGKIVTKVVRNFHCCEIMSKHKKGAPKKTEEIASPITSDKSNNILLNILAKPGAKQNKITEITPEGIGVQINAPPTEGEANAELLKYISTVLGVRKGDVSLFRGFKSRQKTVKVEGSLTLDDVKGKIQKELLDND